MTDLEIAKPKQSARDLIAAITEFDQGDRDWDDEAYQDLWDELGLKVDNYQRLIKYETARAADLGEQIAALQKKKNSSTNLVERVKDRLVFVMKEQGFTALPGTVWRVTLKDSKSVKTKTDATAEKFLMFGQFMSVKYSWNKKKLKAGIKKKDEFALKIAELETSTKPKFDPKEDAGDE